VASLGVGGWRFTIRTQAARCYTSMDRGMFVRSQRE
jgi:hypothetical protein